MGKKVGVVLIVVSILLVGVLIYYNLQKDDSQVDSQDTFNGNQIPPTYQGAEETCADADGDDVYTKNTLKDRGASKTDACSGESVREYICGISGEESYTYPCLRGDCSNGKCVVTGSDFLEIRPGTSFITTSKAGAPQKVIIYNGFAQNSTIVKFIIDGKPQQFKYNGIEWSSQLTGGWFDLTINNVPYRGFVYDQTGNMRLEGAKLGSSGDFGDDGNTTTQTNTTTTTSTNQTDTDADGDGIPNSEDNCPSKANPNQADSDNDGVGDACESEAQFMCSYKQEWVDDKLILLHNIIDETLWKNLQAPWAIMQGMAFNDVTNTGNLKPNLALYISDSQFTNLFGGYKNTKIILTNPDSTMREISCEATQESINQVISWMKTYESSATCTTDLLKTEYAPKNAGDYSHKTYEYAHYMSRAWELESQRTDSLITAAEKDSAAKKKANWDAFIEYAATLKSDYQSRYDAWDGKGTSKDPLGYLDNDLSGTMRELKEAGAIPIIENSQYTGRILGPNGYGIFRPSASGGCSSIALYYDCLVGWLPGFEDYTQGPPPWPPLDYLNQHIDFPYGVVNDYNSNRRLIAWNSRHNDFYNKLEGITWEANAAPRYGAIDNLKGWPTFNSCGFTNDISIIDSWNKPEYWTWRQCVVQDLEWVGNEGKSYKWHIESQASEYNTRQVSGTNLRYPAEGEFDLLVPACPQPIAENYLGCLNTQRRTQLCTYEEQQWKRENASSDSGPPLFYMSLGASSNYPEHGSYKLTIGRQGTFSQYDQDSSIDLYETATTPQDRPRAEYGVDYKIEGCSTLPCKVTIPADSVYTTKNLIITEDDIREYTEVIGIEAKNPVNLKFHSLTPQTILYAYIETDEYPIPNNGVGWQCKSAPGFTQLEDGKVGTFVDFIFSVQYGILGMKCPSGDIAGPATLENPFLAGDAGNYNAVFPNPGWGYVNQNPPANGFKVKFSNDFTQQELTDISNSYQCQGVWTIFQLVRESDGLTLPKARACVPQAMIDGTCTGVVHYTSSDGYQIRWPLDSTGKYRRGSSPYDSTGVSVGQVSKNCSW